MSEDTNKLMAPPSPIATKNVNSADSSTLMPPPSINSNNLMPPPPPPKKQTDNPIQQPIPELIYKEPSWSCSPSINYQLEVIKSGSVLEKQDIYTKPFYLFGRLPICDIIMDHPSISRQHAVIQHREEGQLFLFDLNSTHGSFINKKRCKPLEYNPLRSGDVLKFGESTRLYVIEGGEVQQQDDRIQQQQISKSENESDKQSKAFIHMFTSTSKRNFDQQKEIREMRGNGWGLDDKFDAKEEYDDDDNEIENADNNIKEKNYKSSNNLISDGDDISNLREIIKQNEQSELEGSDDQDDDEFYNRTEQFKDRWMKNIKNESYTNQLSIRESLMKEKQEIHQKFKLATASIGKLENKDESGEEDSLDKFMSENSEHLRKKTQQELMNRSIDIEKKLSFIEQILRQHPEYRKKLQQEKIQQKEYNNYSALQQLGHETQSNQLSQQKISNEENIPTTMKSILKNDDDDDDEGQKKKRVLVPLSDEIPEEYLDKSIGKRLNTESSQVKSKRIREELKQKQETEFVDLIERENQIGNQDNKFGY